MERPTDRLPHRLARQLRCQAIAPATLSENSGFDLYTSSSTPWSVISPTSPSSIQGDYTSGVSSPTVLTRPQSTILSPTHYSTPASSTPPRGSSSWERTKSRPPRSRPRLRQSLRPPIYTDISANSADKGTNTSTKSPSSHSVGEGEGVATPAPPLRIPPLSFTRTMGGLSLIPDVKTLAALFPPEERHLLVCCRDLDLDSDLDEGCFGYGSSEEDHEEDADDCDVIIGDLRRFGLGIDHTHCEQINTVWLTSLLGENGVNHMYSSIFKIANLLVSKRHTVSAGTTSRMLGAHAISTKFPEMTLSFPTFFLNVSHKEGSPFRAHFDMVFPKQVLPF
ncbi:hypothetical protein P691DRAFT_786496 [Macrolepiota fuliginosa MF-IS2]|uniref:Uncharacterized protein n=1 Tax=Macrolepiota fuliginosa MF-IS2 TaxID=1400762 RepID=A0A9P5X4B3_9AGAR|nr:hypothetical protein P691DRAFT_786496 [Macrolepiota fuliginosa MF-IS2]